MGIFGTIRDGTATLGLDKLRRDVINPKLGEIGTVDEIAWQGGQLRLRARLSGLEDQPVEIVCSDISIAPDGSAITIGSFDSNLPCVKNALDCFVSGKTFSIPPDARARARLARSLAGL